jgi:hypothetical protein
VRKKASWFPLHYNVSVHAAVKEKRFLATYDVIVNPTYSPNLVPDVLGFATLKQRMFQQVKDIKQNVHSSGRV